MKTKIEAQDFGTKAFEGTIAGKKFLFLAEQETLERVAEIPAGQSAEVVALKNAVALVARAKANEKAVRALFKAWAADKRAVKAASPEAVAAKAEKDAVRAQAKAIKAEARIIAKTEKAKEKAFAQAAKLEAALAALRQQA